MKSSSREETRIRLAEILEQADHLPCPEGGSRREMPEYYRHFYARVPAEDLRNWSDADLVGAAYAMWHFAGQRKPGEAAIRVYNPDVETHGWQCRYTVVEIVTEDMPFIVDSLSAALDRLDHNVHLSIHPVYVTMRDKDGRLTSLQPPKLDRKTGRMVPGQTVESFTHFQIDRQSDSAILEAIRTRLTEIMSDVRASVEDWQPMRQCALRVVDEIKTLAERKSAPDAEECRLAQEFLLWAEDNHFTFLGYRNYDFVTKSGRTETSITKGKGLGLLRDETRRVFVGGKKDQSVLPQQVLDTLIQPELLLVTKASDIATVHRPVHMDVLILRRFDAKGHVIGVHLFLGLFTSVAYSRSPFEIPYLREKTQRIIEAAGYPRDSHDGKALAHILSSYPRDELFQIQEAQLLDIAIGILDLQERRRTALFLRQDPFERFYMALVYVPRDDYDTALRQRIEHILEEQLGARCADFYTSLDISPLARVHFVMATEPGVCRSFDRGVLERRIREAARSWIGHLEEALIDQHGEEVGRRLMRRYGHAFPAGYRDKLPAQLALFDITRIERLLTHDGLEMSLYKPMNEAKNQLRFKIYHRHHPVPLYDVLPMLENMGLRVHAEVPWEMELPGDHGRVFIHDFACHAEEDHEVELAEIRQPFHEAFLRVWNGEIRNDSLNGLVLRAGLSWREVVILRTYSKYLRQARFHFSQSAIADSLLQHPAIARKIVQLFHLWHQPDVEDRGAQYQACEVELRGKLDAVSNVDDDTILRRFVTLIKATLRTNYYQRDEDGNSKDYVAFKVDSQAVPDLPLPRPMVEIFVYSPRVEAVHLRGGKVARGGIRWSDRREDFRTEILGLMKAQMVKNGVIVPVGAKGGFVVKQPPPVEDREAFLQEGIACYKIMICGLLDVTDNRQGNKIISPPDVVCHDGEDPYLVVAADKGTAKFSDIANQISQDYGFWLDDAFASGGSSGYDHKAMGITARGAWESVKRHFREMGKDIQREDFTVVGVGDMAGDVFGNGMLLSEHIRLIGAFNHKHIFCDPNPDAAKSFRERKRLFEMAGSQWSDYDKKLLSEGGAIFERSAKSLKLTPEIKTAFGLREDTISPNDLIRTLLRAEVELLWFGGIGTYIKSSRESHADVGDKANDILRVDGGEIKARVIAEGANLGVTQLGRIEYARIGGSGSGGRINTDFIDNSAGVDTSDHEVNIKILLKKAVDEGDLTLKQRNDLLVKMEDEVAELVLRDNYLQTAALSLAEATAVEQLQSHSRYIRNLTRRGLLDPKVEYLPDVEAIEERARRQEGLTRPELAVLLAYAKITLYGDLLSENCGTDAFDRAALADYFPAPLRKSCAERIDKHQLKCEIVATQITNSLVNRMGPVFVSEIQEKTGHDPDAIARAYAVARHGFGLRELWRDIESLDGQISGETQIAMLQRSVRLIERTVPWFLRHLQHPIAVEEEAARIRDVVERLADKGTKVLTPPERKIWRGRIAPLKKAGVPEELAERVAALPLLASTPDLSAIAAHCERDVEHLAKIYFLIGQRFGLSWMREQIQNLEGEDHWQKLAADAILDDLFAHQAHLASQILREAPEKLRGEECLDWWANARQPQLERIDRLLADLQDSSTVDLAMLAVANAHFRRLAD